mmetsp:Transcript_129713/g.242572  ORF Transcript_129713/g.242572 Transcript_129713/m.242572 type:complete len:127 (+) Transcript_129713:227-607(+)
MFQHVLVTFNFKAQGKVVKSQQSASKHKQAHILATCAAWARLRGWSTSVLQQRHSPLPLQRVLLQPLPEFFPPPLLQACPTRVASLSPAWLAQILELSNLVPFQDESRHVFQDESASTQRHAGKCD